MYTKKLSDCPKFTAGDNTQIRETLHADKGDFALNYSLAHATVKPGETTYKHSLKTSEVYYILRGEGMMHINDESEPVLPDTTIYIPPHAVQRITNTGDTDLVFLCIVEPAWKEGDETIF